MGIIIQCYTVAANQMPSDGDSAKLMSDLQSRRPIGALPLNSAIAAEALAALEDLDPKLFAGALEPGFVAVVPPAEQAALHTKVDDVLDQGAGEDYALAVCDLLEEALAEAMRTGGALAVVVR